MAGDKDKKLVLIDGHAILHRAYHALPPLTSRVGQVNAVYGFTSMLLKIISELKPSYIAVCLDRKEKTFRKEMFEAYQAQRPEVDKELISQVELTKEVISAFGIKIFSVAGFEADDVIGTLAKKAEGNSEIEEVIIVTGDRDILQLVGGKIRVYLLVKGISEASLFGKDEVEAKMGVLPHLIVDYKALVGDASDNYSGVSGIGPKTAVKLICEFGGFEEIYKNLDKLPPKTREILIKGKESGELSFRLAKIRTDVPLEVSFDDLKKWQVDSQKVFDIFEEFGFKSLAKRVKELGKTMVTENQMQLF
ncbi:MAG: DNA polymerase I [Candidatus Woesebacteria bacterium]|nr:MAG: DNA polymerase I [Candidatus Woesebacteria bacterium]